MSVYVCMPVLESMCVQVCVYKCVCVCMRACVNVCVHACVVVPSSAQCVADVGRTVTVAFCDIAAVISYVCVGPSVLRL